MTLSSAGSANALHHTALWVARSAGPGLACGVSSAPGALDRTGSTSETNAFGAGGGVTLNGRTSAHAPGSKVTRSSAISAAGPRGVATAVPAGRGERAAAPVG